MWAQGRKATKSRKTFQKRQSHKASLEKRTKQRTRWRSNASNACSGLADRTLPRTGPRKTTTRGPLIPLKSQKRWLLATRLTSDRSSWDRWLLQVYNVAPFFKKHTSGGCPTYCKQGLIHKTIDWFTCKAPHGIRPQFL